MNYIGYIIDSEIGTVINLTPVVKAVCKVARAQIDKKTLACMREESDRCPICNRIGKLEVHHKSPLWALATEFCIEKMPESLDSETILANHNSGFGHWSQRENLCVLCTSCHATEQIFVDRSWKLTLALKYKFFFGNLTFNPPEDNHYISTYIKSWLFQQRMKMRQELHEAKQTRSLLRHYFARTPFVCVPD